MEKSQIWLEISDKDSAVVKENKESLGNIEFKFQKNYQVEMFRKHL